MRIYLKCPVCGYERTLRNKEKKKGRVKTTCPKCGNRMAIVKQF